MNFYAVVVGGFLLGFCISTQRWDSSVLAHVVLTVALLALGITVFDMALTS